MHNTRGNLLNFQYQRVENISVMICKMSTIMNVSMYVSWIHIRQMQFSLLDTKNNGRKDTKDTQIVLKTSGRKQAPYKYNVDVWPSNYGRLIWSVFKACRDWTAVVGYTKTPYGQNRHMKASKPYPMGTLPVAVLTEGVVEKTMVVRMRIQWMLLHHRTAQSECQVSM